MSRIVQKNNYSISLLNINNLINRINKIDIKNNSIKINNLIFLIKYYLKKDDKNLENIIRNNNKTIILNIKDENITNINLLSISNKKIIQLLLGGKILDKKNKIVYFLVDPNNININVVKDNFSKLLKVLNLRQK